MSASIRIYNGSGSPQTITAPHVFTVSSGDSVQLFSDTLEHSGTVFTVEDGVEYSYVIGTTQGILSQENDLTETFYSGLGLGVLLVSGALMLRLAFKTSRNNPAQEML